MTFDTDIIGVITGRANLSNSDAELGAAATTYPTALESELLFREAELSQDFITILGDGRTLDVSLIVENPFMDNIRVMTEVLNRPPECANATPSKPSIWPPNHRFVPINVTGVSDPDGDLISISIESIFQDEAVNGEGDGDVGPDGRGVGSGTAEVRAERAGKNNGRVYLISFSADDGNGGTCSASVQGGVPHDKKGTAVNDGATFDSTTS